MIKRRNYIWLLPLSLIVTFPAWRIPVGAFLTPPTSYDVPNVKNMKQSQNFHMEMVKIIQSKESKTTATIRAQKAFTTETPDEYMLEMVNADLFNEKGEPTNVTARHGIFNNQTQYLTLQDNVVITNTVDNQRLYTDLFFFDNVEQLVHCPVKTRIVGEGMEINGIGLDYDVKKGLYEMGGRVYCTINGSISP